MNSRGRLLSWSLIALLVIAVATPAWAQPPKPKAKPVPAKKAPAAPAADALAPADQGMEEPAAEEPAAEEPAAKKPGVQKPAEETPAPEQPLVIEEPAVRAIVESKPTTPAECARAAKILADLGRPELAKPLLQRILAAKPDQQTLADLADEFGSGMFLDMGARPALQPQSQQLAEAVLAAFNRRLRDPQRIAQWIPQLQDPSIDVRTAALSGLIRAHGASVGPLVAVLADPGRAAEHPNVREVLVRMGLDAIEPLIGLLDRSEPQLTVQAIQVLAAMSAEKAAVYLLGPYASPQSTPAVRAAAGAALKRLAGRLPEKDEALKVLTDRVRAYSDRAQPLDGEVQGRVELWHWDAAKRELVAKEFAADDARRTVADRLARDAYALAPGDHQVELLYLTTLLEAAAYENGLHKPLPEAEGTAAKRAAAFGAGTIQDVLRYAVQSGHAAAASAAARILGRIGTAEELLQRGGGPAPLVQAAQHPDRRLRLAAIEAIVRLQAARPFSGSSGVPESLAFFAGSQGTRRALVAGPSTETSRQLAGMLAAAGLETDTATTGREAFRLVTTSPDYELALIDPSIDQPPVGLLLQQLRRDCRSAGLRVGLIARAGDLERAQRTARQDPMTLALSRPHTAEALRWQMERLAELKPQEFVGFAERQQHAAAALGMLAELGGAPKGLYELSRAQGAVLVALTVPTLSSKAAAVLANLGTPESQRALVELASRYTQPLELRTAAVGALRKNVEKYGVLLSTVEIQRQYDRYNQSETLDTATQRVLGLILDCIEAPTLPSQ